MTFIGWTNSPINGTNGTTCNDIYFKKFNSSPCSGTAWLLVACVVIGTGIVVNGFGTFCMFAQKKRCRMENILLGAMVLDLMLLGLLVFSNCTPYTDKPLQIAALVFSHLFLFSSAFFDAVLALERYLSICHSLKFIKYSFLRRSSFYMAVATIGAILLVGPLCFEDIHCTSDPHLTTWVITAYLVICAWANIAILVTLTTMTINKLHKMRLERNAMVQQQDVLVMKSREVEFKITIVAITSSLMSMTCEGLATILNIFDLEMSLCLAHTTWSVLLMKCVFRFPIYYVIFNYYNKIMHCRIFIN